MSGEEIQPSRGKQQAEENNQTRILAAQLKIPPPHQFPEKNQMIAKTGAKFDSSKNIYQAVLSLPILPLQKHQENTEKTITHGVHRILGATNNDLLKLKLLAHRKINVQVLMALKQLIPRECSSPPLCPRGYQRKRSALPGCSTALQTAQSSQPYLIN